MKVLITGVAGLIGSRLADWLNVHQPEATIIGVDNLCGGFRENIPPEVVFEKLDCAAPELSAVFDKHQPDYVYHLAAYAAEGLSPFIRCYNYQNNLIATANVINQCIKHGVERLVFTSSMAVYGLGSPPFKESDQPAPIDPYGIAKYACEMDIRVAGEQHGLDWCIIRPHNVYGRNQNIWDVYRNVLGIWMYQHLNGEPMTIFGDGQQVRAFSFIDDCLAPLWEAATTPKASRQVINLGGTKSHSIQQANDLLRKVMGGGEVVYQETRHEVKDAHPSWEKSMDLLNYKDLTSLENGLEDTWKWARKQPKRARFIWPEYELERGVYNFWKNIKK